MLFSRFVALLLTAQGVRAMPLKRQAPECTVHDTHCLTYYDPGLGACGELHGGHEMVVALNQPQWDESALNLGFWTPNARCGQMVEISTEHGRNVKARIVDLCPACHYGSLDVSRPVFMALSPFGLYPGRLRMNFTFLDDED